MDRREFMTLVSVGAGAYLGTKIYERFGGRISSLVREDDSNKWSLKPIMFVDHKTGKISEDQTNDCSRVMAVADLVDDGGKILYKSLAVLGAEEYGFWVFYEGRMVLVPMNSMVIKEGYPWKEVVVSKKLGVRLDNPPEYIERIPLFGSSLVRIAGQTEDIGDEGKVFEKTITEADRHGLRALVVFNPFKPLTNDVYRERLGKLLDRHPDVSIELGNEMDNTDPESRFFLGSAEEFGNFVRVAVEEVERRGKKNGLILGALVDPGRNQDVWLRAIVNSGVDLNRLSGLGVHAYHRVSDVEYRMSAVQNSARKFGYKGGYFLTEVGIQKTNKEDLLAMIDKAYWLGMSEVYVHELMDYEGWGLVGPGWNGINSVAWKMGIKVRKGEW